MIADLRRFSKTDFYRGVSYLTEGLLELEREFFEDVFSGQEGEPQAPEAQ